MPQQLETIKITAEQILSHPTWDVILLFVLLAVGFFYGISAGKTRVAATIIYTYVALAVFSVLPTNKLASFFGGVEIFLVKIVVFCALFLVLAFLLGSRKKRGFAPASSWWQIFLLSLLQVGFLIHIILSFLPEEKIKMLAPITKRFFANPDLHIWWLVIPIAVIVLLRRFESDN